MGMFSATQPSEKIRTGSPAQETDASSVLAAGQDCGLVQPLQQEQLQTILDALPQLGASRIRRRIGSGGFSSVYEVEDLNSDQVYALKVTDPLLTAMRKVFSDESRADHARIDTSDSQRARQYFRYFVEKADDEMLISRVISDTQCPNLIPACFTCTLNASSLLGLSYERKLWLIGMPKLLCLDSEDFRTKFRERINGPLLLKLGVDLCNALQTMDGAGRHGALHGREQNVALPRNVSTLYIRPDHPEARLVHRDVKPPNVYIRVQFGADGALLSLDFILGDYGISRMILPGDERQTQIKPDPYKAPEGEASPSSDLYSVAMVMLWVLWGSLPEKTMLHLKTLCLQALPHLADSHPDASPLLPPFAVLAQWMYAIRRDAMLSPQTRTEILQEGGLGICSAALLGFLLDMLTPTDTERPCQSAGAMRDALEKFRLTDSAGADREADLKRMQKTVKELHDNYFSLMAENAVQKQENEELQVRNRQLTQELRDLLRQEAEGADAAPPAAPTLPAPAAKPRPQGKAKPARAPRPEQEFRRHWSTDQAAEFAFAHATTLQESDIPEPEDTIWLQRWREQRGEFLGYRARSEHQLQDLRSALLALCILTLVYSALGIFQMTLLFRSQGFTDWSLMYYFCVLLWCSVSCAAATRCWRSATLDSLLDGLFGCFFGLFSLVHTGLSRLLKRGGAAGSRKK